MHLKIIRQVPRFSLNATISVLSKKTNRFFGFIIAVSAFFFFTGASKTTTIRYISPMPDSKMVSAQTNIIMRILGSLDYSLNKDTSLVFIYGSLSGKHPGHLSISDDNETIVFNPDVPFAPGEIVSVHFRADLRTREGFTIQPFVFSFTISPLSRQDKMQMLQTIKARRGQRDINNNEQAVASSPMYKTNMLTGPLPSGFPELKLIVSNNPSQGNIFLGSYKTDKPGNHMQYAPFVPSDKQYIMIIDNNGSPVYYKKIQGFNTDFKVQPNGHLTYYDDAVSAFYELDTNYSVITAYSAGNGYKIDPHEFRMLSNGHVIFLCQDPEIVDMSAIVSGGNPFATVLGIVIQELDKNKNVVFQWRSFDHFKITDATHEDLDDNLIDYVHSNAIEYDTDGNILLSSRHLDEITKIDRATGNIIWRWGGKNNQFTFINDSIHFSHQHTIRKTPTGTYSLFDNGNFRTPAFSRALEYMLDEKAKTATLVWQYRHTPDIFSMAMSSMQRLPNGNTFIGWGTASAAAVTEVRPDGTVALELQFPDSIVSYRAFRSPWPLSSASTNVLQQSNETITSFSLHQNYPNPFNPTTTIQFDLKKRANVSLKIYDMLGRTIATLIEKEMSAGNYSVPFNATVHSSGTYLAVLKITVGDQSGKNVHTYTRKMTLSK